MLHMQITKFKYDCFDPILPLLGEKSSKIESGIYYYHADHLGSSSVVTDKNGKFHEHLEYFPYGETWINDRANNENLPYKFTGKELDPETGLYYYGARYFDARLSRWISADPILNSYLDGKPNGGVYNSRNIDLYQYCFNNPIMFHDSTGLSADARLVNTQLGMSIKRDANGVITIGGPTDKKLYKIVQATKNTNTGNLPIYNATTGEYQGDYQAGHFYINVGDRIYDVSDVRLSSSRCSRTLYQHLTNPSLVDHDQPKYTRAGLVTYLGNGKFGVTNGTTSRRVAVWLSTEDLEILSTQGKEAAALVDHLTKCDDALVEKRLDKGLTTPSRSVDAANWHHDLIGLRAMDYYNKNYYPCHRAFQGNVMHSVSWDGSVVDRINGFIQTTRHVTDEDE